MNLNELFSNDPISEKYRFGMPPVFIENYEIEIPEMNILRMLVRKPLENFYIPNELKFLEEKIKHFGSLQPEWYIYITIRSGYPFVLEDDFHYKVLGQQPGFDWHVDGFSMTEPHRPEVNFIWVDINPTEFYVKEMFLPEDFDPLNHNVHLYFQDLLHDTPHNFKAKEKGIYALSPYVIHRRPIIPDGQKRAFFRISLIPVVIDDDRNTQNPLLPMGPFNTVDIRTKLKRYTFKAKDLT